MNCGSGFYRQYWICESAPHAPLQREEISTLSHEAWRVQLWTWPKWLNDESVVLMVLTLSSWVVDRQERRGSPVKEINVLVLVTVWAHVCTVAAPSIAISPYVTATHTQALSSSFRRGWLPSVGASHDKHTAVRKHFDYNTNECKE